MRRWMRQALRLAQRLVLTDVAPPPAPVPVPAGPPPEAVPEPEPESGIPAALVAEEIPAISAPPDPHEPGPHEQLPLPLLVQPAGPGVSVPGTFIHSQGTRDYLLYLPPLATGQPPPLVVMLHGCGQDAADFARGTGMDEAARPRRIGAVPRAARLRQSGALLELVFPAPPAAQPRRAGPAGSDGPAHCCGPWG